MIKFDYIPETPLPAIHQFRVIDLEPRELARCKELSFGDDGYMCEDLDDILANEKRWYYRNSQAILLGENWGRIPPLGGKGEKLRAWPIYGWALLQPIYRKSRWSAQFFVDPLHRGKGYGKLLLERANKHSQRPYVYPDAENRGFFAKYSDMVEELEDKAA